MNILKESTTLGSHKSFLPKKLYHEQRGQPSSIGDVGGFPIGRWIIPMSINGGEPFNGGGNKPPRGDGGDPTWSGNSGPLRNCGNGPQKDQNPRSYATRLQGPWIGPTWNPWYLPWYHVQPLIEFLCQIINLYPTPSTLQEGIPMFMYEFFARPFKPMEKRMMMVSSICFFLHFMMPCIRMGKEFMKPICIFEELEATLYKHYWKVQTDEQVYMVLRMI